MLADNPEDIVAYQSQSPHHKILLHKITFWIFVSAGDQGKILRRPPKQNIPLWCVTIFALDVHQLTLHGTAQIII